MVSANEVNMLRAATLLVGIFCSPVLLAGECIEVTNNEITALDTEYGITTAEWLADIRNHCDDPYDATLTIKLLDADDNVVHESLEIVIVESRGIDKARQTMSIPEDHFQSVDRVEVSVEERARPI